MDHASFLDAIARESAALAAAARSVDFTTGVPSCPGWDVRELVGHIGQLQRWVTAMVHSRATERLSLKTLAKPPTDETLLPWFEDATVGLLSMLRSTDPATPVWTWTAERSAGYWARRQAHEAAIHRWDAQRATAVEPQPLHAELAADGVDELLELHQGTRPQRLSGTGESVHLHSSDVPGEWVIRLQPQGAVVEHLHAKGDVAGIGSASDLALFLWGRVGVDRLKVFGDRALLERFQTITAL